MTEYLQEYDSEDLVELLQQRSQKIFLNILMAEQHKKYDSEYLGVHTRKTVSNLER